jgi:hypothetical protein
MLPAGFDRGLIEQFLSSESETALRIGIMSDGLMLPAFGQAVIDGIRGQHNIEVVALIRLPMPSDAPAPSAGSLRARLAAATYRMYQRTLDRHSLDHAADGAVDARALLTAVPVTGIAARDELSPLELEQLASLRLDVILDFSHGPVLEPVAALCRFGIWRYCFDAGGAGFSYAPLMFEFLRGDAVSSTELRQYGPRAGDCKVLATTRCSMVRSTALSRSQAAAAWCSSHLAIVELHRLQQAGSKAVSAEEPPDPVEAAPTTRQLPTPGAFARWGGRYAARAIRNRLLHTDRVLHWQIGLRRSSQTLLTQLPDEALPEFHWLQSPRGHFWADPFLVAHDGRHWLFYEDYDHTLGRANLKAGTLAADGSLEDSVQVLDSGQHLSYPHVFFHDGEAFMVPETSAQGVVQLYRASRFPDRWQPEATLLRLRAVDSTVFPHAGRWWMFTSPMTLPGHAAVTLLYSAGRLTGPWKLHPASPISSDARTARNAGAVFEHQGRLVRPSQDCGGLYGRALLFNLVTRLDDCGYEEATISGVSSHCGISLSGIHTYNRCGPWEVIDGRFLRQRAEIM